MKLKLSNRYAANVAIRRRLVAKLWAAEGTDVDAIQRALHAAHELAEQM
jgi:hypothetical protein